MINVTRSSMPDYDEYCKKIEVLWSNRWLTNMGELHNEFEARLCNYLNCDNITLYANGHLALENAIALFDFPKGAEIITTPFTFASTTHAIVRNGLTPVFADIKQDDYTINPESVKKLISDKTVAIVPVHVYGNLCEISQLDEIAKENNIKIIYDAAHAFGVTRNGISVANFGDLTMFSFHATKVFNSIEGGALCYNDKGKKHILDNYKNFGISDGENVEYVGGNAKMNEFQAAMGICNLAYIDEEIEKRKFIVNRYKENLEGRKGIMICSPQDGVKSNYAYFPVVFKNYRKTRDDILIELKERGIFARKYFYPLTNSFKCYKNLHTAKLAETPVAKDVSENVLTLPLYSDLDLATVDYICELICK